MMIDLTTLLIMASCVCSAMSIMFTFYSYFHPENIPWMQGLFDIFRKKEDDEDVLLPAPPVPTSEAVGGLDWMSGPTSVQRDQ